MSLNLRVATPDDGERIVRFWHDSGASMGPGDSVESVGRAISLSVAEPNARRSPYR